MSTATMGWPDRMLRESEVTTRRIHRCFFCSNDIPAGEVVVSFAAIDQQGGFTHGYRHNYECYTGRGMWQ